MKTMTWLKLKLAVGASVALLAGGAATAAVSQTVTNQSSSVTSGALTPETFITHDGVYQNKDGATVIELTVRNNGLKITSTASLAVNSASKVNWRAGKGWFVYVAKDLKIWAYNGEQDLSLLMASPEAARSYSMAYLQEAPPAAVLKRLPSAVRKMLPKVP